MFATARRIAQARTSVRAATSILPGKTMRHVLSMGAMTFALGCGFVSSAAASSAEDFAVLAGAAVTCTGSTVNGNVGLANPGTVTNTGCTINSQAGTPAAQSAYATFLADYANLRTQPPCDFNNAPLAGAFLLPGVYCYDAAVTVTNATLTLVGTASDTWIFRI